MMFHLFHLHGTRNTLLSIHTLPKCRGCSRGGDTWNKIVPPVPGGWNTFNAYSPKG